KTQSQAPKLFRGHDILHRDPHDNTSSAFSCAQCFLRRWGLITGGNCAFPTFTRNACLPYRADARENQVLIAALFLRAIGRPSSAIFFSLQQLRLAVRFRGAGGWTAQGSADCSSRPGSQLGSQAET